MFNNHNVSIHPDTGAVLSGIHPDHNIYYTVNTVRPGFTGSKPSKADIVASRFAHVDIDPSPGWDKGATLAALIEAGATVVVDSGYGLQGLWAVVCPVAEVEAINRGLIARFGADRGTWNADRLFRVPGYTNYPNAKKRAAGRVESIASLLWSDGPEWAADELRVAFPEPAPAAPSAPDVTLGPWQVETVESLGLPPDLAALVSDTGPDRSSHSMSIAARMARAQYTNEQIMGLLMNPDYPWSGTIHEQADPERQAVRKVRDAAALRPDMDALFPPVAAVGVLPEPPLVTRVREAGFTQHNGGMLLPEEQLEYFKGCVYISSMDKVMTPSGELFGQSQFDNTYGGQAFVITSDGQGAPSKSAWEAFHRNQRFKAPRVNDLCFRPELPSLSVVEDGSWRLLNSYIPIETPRTEGDPSKFLDWLSRLLPVERDRRILLSYCASIIQNPGLKAQWWPVLIGTMGNGKTLILSAIEHCIGSQYVHLPNSSKMTRSGINFNGWMRGKLFLGLEEIYSAQRRDFLEEFKPYVTNRRLPIEGKGIEEYTGDNRANGIMLTNHIDGVPINPNERRYAPFITAQESEEDCYRDGMTSAYFSDIWDWLEGRNAYAHHGSLYGFRVVNHYLQNYTPDPEFDPNQQATRRPKTSCFDRAVEAGRGGVEQEIMAAIDEERVGFAGGWVSSKFLDDLMTNSRVKVPRNKRKDLMQTLGYHWHPGLEQGKATSVLQPDGIRSRLYVRMGTPQAAISEPGAICRAYTQAQIETKLGS